MPHDLPRVPLRSVTEEEIATFWRDGVVHLPGVLPTSWLDALAGPIETVLRTGEAADLGVLAADPRPSAPRFAAGVDHWRHDPVFAAFATSSPVPALAAALLRSTELWLWEDSVLVKEPGSPYRTEFHSDAGYFQVMGEQVCTAWVPLDAADAGNGMLSFVRGSHLDGVEYRPNLFTNEESIPGTQGVPVPDVLGDPEWAERLITFDVVPGDMTVHHYRTLHGAGANGSADRRRRAVSLRYCGDDARYRHKAGLPRRPGLDGAADGDRLGPPDCPLVWPDTRS